MTFPSRLRASLVLLAALAACDGGPELPTAISAPDDAAPRLVLAGPDAIAGRYVVVFRDGQVSSAAAAAQELVPAGQGTVHYTYEHAFKGFAAELPPARVQAVLADARVAYVAQDGWMSLAGTQTSAPWGLDRIDQRDNPRDGVYTYSHTGEGVTAYVIDSGIRISHVDFGGRATVGADFVYDGWSGRDCHGHGTHVAGVIGGATYGVAKQVNLVSVRVFNCRGSSIPSSTAIAAVDWVADNAVRPAVVNMSLSGAASEPLDHAVRNSIAMGLVYTVAAGNQGIDACGQSPARIPQALTVGATSYSDFRVTSSNWGRCVDLFAPGSEIPSARGWGDDGSSSGGGTSVAAAHVAGVAATYLETHPDAAPAAVASLILTSASYNRIADTVALHNRLLYSPLVADPVVITPPAMNFVVRGQAGSGPAAVTGVGTAADTVLVMNHGAAPITWSASDSVAWMRASPAGGTVAPGATAVVEVTVTADSIPWGEQRGTMVVTAGSLTHAVTVTATRIDVLQSGVPLTGLSGALWSLDRLFVIAVPAGADSLKVAITDGSGQADLYVRRGAVPDFGWSDCRSNGWGVYERCVMVRPAAGEYFVRLAGGGYSGVTFHATIFRPPPAAPGTVTATGAGAGKVNVTWADGSHNETHFRVRRSTRNAEGTFGAYQTVGQRGANNTTLLDSTVVLGATYRYQVQACSDVGCSSSAPSAAITIVLPPAAPTGLRGWVMPGGQVDLVWTDASGNEASFRVRRGTRNPDGTFGAYQALQTLPAGSTSYSNTGAVLGATYRYQVQACNGAGCGTSSTLAVTVPTLPAAPTGVSAQAIFPTMVNLAWTDASSNEGQFRIRRTTRNPDGSYGPYQTVGTRSWSVTSHTDQTATPGATHRYIIQACNASGCRNSPAVSVTMPAS